MWVDTVQLEPYEKIYRVPWLLHTCTEEEPWLGWDYADARISCRWVVGDHGLDPQLAQARIIWCLHIPQKVLVHTHSPL